jgi:hypothetical protein
VGGGLSACRPARSPLTEIPCAAAAQQAARPASSSVSSGGGASSRSPFESGTSCAEELLDADRRATRHVLDLRSGRRQERVEAELGDLTIAHVHTIEREHV